MFVRFVLILKSNYTAERVVFKDLKYVMTIDFIIETSIFLGIDTSLCRRGSQVVDYGKKYQNIAKTSGFKP